MPTQRTVVVAPTDPGGYDAHYTSLATAESTEQADLVALDRNQVIECEAFTNTITARLDFAGWATDETRNITIKPAAGHEHNGVYGSGYILQQDSALPALRLENAYTVLHGITIIVPNANVYDGALTLLAINCEVDGCIFVGVVNDNNRAIDNNAAGSTIRNCLFDTWNYGLYSRGADATINNCTAIDCDIGILCEYGKGTPYNCVAYGSVTSGFDVAGNAEAIYGTNNASGDSTANGLYVSGITGITTADFVDYAGGNYRPAFKSVLRGAGTDPGTFTRDIGGQKRYDWTIGAFEMPMANYARVMPVDDGELNAYTSLGSAEAGKQGNLTINGPLLIECETMTGGGFADFDGWFGIDADHNINIYNALGHHHNGVWQAGYYHLQTSNAGAIELAEQYCHLQGICVESQGSSSFDRAVMVKSPFGVVNEVIAKANPVESSNACFDDDGRSSYYNCVALGGGIGFQKRPNGGFGDIVNCTAVNCTIGFKNDRARSITISNCVAWNNGTNYVLITETWNGVNNAGETGDAVPGTNPITTVTVDDFLDPMNNLYHPSYGSVLYDTGADLTATHPNDVRGVTRTINNRGAYGGPTYTELTLGNSGGETYSTIQSAESAAQATVSVAGDVNAVILASAFLDEPAVIVDFDGAVTDSSRFIQVRPAAGAHHGGVLGQGYRLKPTKTNSTALRIRDQYTRFIGISVECIGTTANDHAVEFNSIGGNNGLVQECFLKAQRNISTCAALMMFDPDCRAINCVMYDSATGVDMNANGAALINCTIENCGIGVDMSSGNDELIVINNAVFDCTQDRLGSASGIIADARNNADEDPAAMPGLGSAVSESVGSDTLSLDNTAFVDTASGDYAAAIGGVLEGAGADLSAWFVNDITGTARTVPWDIGAFIAAAGGGPASLSPDSITQTVTIEGTTLALGSVALATNSLAQVQVLQTPNIFQASSLSTDGVDQTQAIDDAAITQANNLSPGGVDQTQEIDTATITQAGAIGPAGIEQTHAVEATTLTQAHILLPVGVVQSQALAATTLATIGTIAADSIVQTQSIDGALLTVAAALDVDGISQAQALESLELIQAHILAPNGVTQSHALDPANLNAAALNLAPHDVANLQSLGAPDLTQYHILAVDGISQEQIIQAALFSGLVIGSLEGKVVLYAAIDGNVFVTPGLTGTIQ